MGISFFFSFVFHFSSFLEKALATHSSTLAWRIPWTEEPGRLQSMGSRRVRHDWATSFWLSLLFFSQLFVRPPQTAILSFCISLSWGMSCSLSPVHNDIENEILAPCLWEAVLWGSQIILSLSLCCKHGFCLHTLKILHNMITFCFIRKRPLMLQAGSHPLLPNNMPSSGQHLSLFYSQSSFCPSQCNMLSTGKNAQSDRW